MRFQRVRIAATGLLAAMVAAAAMAPAEAATRAKPKKVQREQVQRVDGWGSPYYLTGGKAVFAPAGSTYGGYPSWARAAFEHYGG